MATRAVEGRSRRYDPSETRQRILDAAGLLFAAQGYVETGTADIARAADVSEGSIFYHFGTKRSLLAELGRRYGEAIVAAMHQEGEDLADLEPGVSVRRCFEYCVTHREWDGIRGAPASRAEQRHDPETAPFHREARKVIVAFIERVLRAVDAREGRSSEMVPVTASLMHATVGAGLDMALAEPDPARRAAIMEETIRFMRAASGYREDGGTPAR